VVYGRRYMAPSQAPLALPGSSSLPRPERVIYWVKALGHPLRAPVLRFP